MRLRVDEVNPRRVARLNSTGERDGLVIYWMSRDQRVDDNWALLFAREIADRKKSPVAVVFCLVPEFLGATIRHYDFMIEGLKGLERLLREKGIPFFLTTGNPSVEIPVIVNRLRAGALVCDFDPLRLKGSWKHEVLKHIEIAAYEVDAHNIVPCREVSGRQEYSARTFRIKINKKLDVFLEKYPQLRAQKKGLLENYEAVDWERVRGSLRVNEDVPAVEWLNPGESEARTTLDKFLEDGLIGYSDGSNDPNSGARSDLSPYLHFGQISSGRVFLEVLKVDAPEDSKDSFLEELLVRRELADNFCFYNPNYDNVVCFPGWVADTLETHIDDPRAYIYSRNQLEYSDTHDELWNAAQTEMVKLGKMHGYMRMYWAKKILEWTRTPAEALDTAIYLNDKYELDGRDPNGYTGIAWSIGGIHDRAWKERSVFGKVRYMSFEGCRRKFDVDRYISSIRAIDTND